MNKETDVAWAAGLFEGEGCITDDKKKYRRLQLSMTDEDVMEKFVRIVNYGRLNGPYIPGKPGFRRAKHKPFWYWSVGRRSEVLRILKMFIPYFGQRRSQKAIEAISKIEIIN
tara:strand:+ start:138 stop:476 length:339 start_codon:yes stop_codon:yes gene_type:complete